MVMLGIVFGLFAATGQSLAYVLSRGFSVSAGGGPIRLLVMSHVLMGAAGAPLMAMLWPAELELSWPLVTAVVGMAWAYMAGHACLMTALRYTSASRVAPVLGFKIVILAIVTATLLGDLVTGWQWTAVVLAVTATFALNYTGGMMPWQGLLGTLAACVGYSMSDISFRMTMERLEQIELLYAAVFAMTAAYTVCGLTLLPLLPWFGSRRLRQWQAVGPYTAAWMVAMMFVFMCYAAAGIVLGNIVQSSRGLISLALGAAIAAQGMAHLEVRVSPVIFWRRVAAALMMTVAVALYVWGAE